MERRKRVLALNGALSFVVTITERSANAWVRNSATPAPHCRGVHKGGLRYGPSPSDVNKDLTFKAKDKDQTLKAKEQDNNQTYKDKDQDKHPRTRTRTRTRPSRPRTRTRTRSIIINTELN